MRRGRAWRRRRPHRCAAQRPDRAIEPADCSAARPAGGTSSPLLDDAVAQECVKEVPNCIAWGPILKHPLGAGRRRRTPSRRVGSGRACALEAEDQNLEQYRSEFFGRLKRALGNQEGVRNEGDRFAFSSEVLFPPGCATLSTVGPRKEIAKVAGILRNIRRRHSAEIDWSSPLTGIRTTAFVGFGRVSPTIWS